MFRKHVNTENTGNSFSSGGKSEPFDSFDELDEMDLSNIELSELLKHNTDSSWNDMIHSYDSFDPAKSSRFNPDNSGGSSIDDAADDSDLGDDFDSDFGDDLDSNLSDDFDGSLGDDFDGGLGDDFDGNADDYYENPDLDQSDEDYKKRYSSLDSSLFKKIIFAMIAIIVGLGILVIVKSSKANGDYTIPSSPSDSSVTDSVNSDNSDAESQPVSSQEPLPEEKPVYAELQKGSSGKNVTDLQNRLCELGYIGKDSCTGYYGDFTTKIIKKFQKNAGLPETGIADQATQEKLFSDDAPSVKK